MLKELRTALVVLLAVSLIAGVIYPSAMAGFAWLFFKGKGGGQLVVDGEGKVVGSRLVGQHFEDPVYFWGRPSVSRPAPYTPYDAKSGVAAGASNMGPNDPRLVQAVKERTQRLRKVDPDNKDAVPVELVTASGSGLDPEISPAGAYYQAGRVARLRGVPVEQINSLIAEHVKARDLGVLGEERVNVLELNMALDEKYPAAVVK